TLGRRFSDVYRASLGVNVQKIAADAQLPAGFVFPTGAVINPLTGTGTNTLTGVDPNSPSAAVGVLAPSLAQIDSTRPYNLRSFVLGIGADTRDDIFNPRRGVNLT